MLFKLCERGGFIPASLPGAQMMANLLFIKNKMKSEINESVMTEHYVPTLNNHIISNQNCKFVPASGKPDSGRFRLKYVPAQMQGIFEPPGNEKIKKISWWENNSFFKYNCMLISAFYGIKWVDNFREYFNIPNDFILIGDSGGFQNLTQNANLDPLKILRWQEKHCQIGFTFDYPIAFCKELNEIRDRQRKTVENAFFALNKKQNKNMKLYCVFHGENLDGLYEHEKMYLEKGDLNSFDGFGLGNLAKAKMSDIIHLVLSLCEINKNYNKPIHLFGVSGLSTIPIIYYIAKKYNFTITFDSSSYGGGAIRKEYWLNYGNFKLEFSDKNPTAINSLPCSCEVCKICNIDDYRKEGSISGGLLALHNLKQTIEYCNLLNILLDDEIIFLEYVRTQINGSYEMVVKIKTMFDKSDFKIEKYFPINVKYNKFKKSNIFNF